MKILKNIAPQKAARLRNSIFFNKSGKCKCRKPDAELRHTRFHFAP